MNNKLADAENTAASLAIGSQSNRVQRRSRPAWRTRSAICKPPRPCVTAATPRRRCSAKPCSAVLGQVVARFPLEPGALTDWADMALLRGHMAEAHRRCALLRERFPDHPFGYVVAEHALRDSGDTTEAERLLSEAMIRFPAEAGALVDWANLALRRRDLEEALRRAWLLQERWPDNPSAFVIAAHALHAGGDAAKTEGMLEGS